MAGKSLTTLRTIAEKIGVSTSTVSRVLNGKSRQCRISPQTTRAVLEAAERLNFRPSHLARSLRLRKTQTLGLLIPDISNPFFAQIARSVETAARQRGYSMILADTRESTEAEIAAVRLLSDRQVDGLIILPVGQSGDHLRALADEDLAAVIVDRDLPDLALPCVTSDNFGGAYEAVGYLLDRGHRGIACLQGLPGTRPNEQRVRGWRQAMSDRGVTADPRLVRGDRYDTQSGYEQTLILLDRAPDVTALFALSNLIALGAIRALAERGRRIPQDVSLVCFDDQPWLAHMDPPITTVDQQNVRMGQIAVELLLDRLAGRPLGDHRILLPTRFIERQSVRTLNRERVNA